MSDPLGGFLVLSAIILSAFALIESRGRDLSAWAMVCLIVGLVLLGIIPRPLV